VASIVALALTKCKTTLPKKVNCIEILPITVYNEYLEEEVILKRRPYPGFCQEGSSSEQKREEMAIK
jgi:hypothetical protein